MNIAKWTIAVIAVAALIFGAIQTSFLRQELTEQKNILTVVQDSQSEKLAELEQEQSRLREEIEDLGNKLSSKIADLSSKQTSGVVWSYGTSIPGSGDGQLFYPTTAEEIGNNTILVADKRNNRVLLLDKTSGEVNWEYRDDTDKLQPSSAHVLSSGIYKDCILIAGRYYDGTKYIGKIRIIDISKTLKWSFDMDNEDFGDAILWDENNLMVSSRMKGKITKIDLRDKTETWAYGPLSSGIYPMFLQKLTDKDVYKGSYGGDLLFGTEGSLVREIDTSDGSTKWEYGGKSDQGWGGGEFTYENPQAPVCALRLGSGEHVENSEALTIICAFQSCEIFAVTHNKAKVWQIGGVTPGASATYMRDPSPQGGILLHTPFFVSPTKSGNLLIADALGNKVLEIVPHFIPLRQAMETWIFNYATTNDWRDSEIIETRWFGKKNIIVMNTNTSNSSDWRLLGSPDANNWVEIKTSATLEAGKSTFFLIEEPWAFIKAQVKSSNKDIPSYIAIYAHCLRE